MKKLGLDYNSFLTTEMNSEISDEITRLLLLTDYPMDDSPTFDSFFGGHFMLYETKDTGDINDKMLLDILYTTIWDVIEVLDNFVELHFVTNNAGGNTYFIDKSLVDIERLQQ